MKRSGTSSLGRKLTGIIMVITTCVLVLSSVAYLLADLSATRSQQAADLSILARVVGDNASASIMFGDRQAATEVLQSLRAKPSVIAACIYTDGKVFATYGAKSAAMPAVRSNGVVYASRTTEIFQSIRLGNEVVGTIYIAGDRRREVAKLIRHGQIGSVILLVALLVAFVMSTRLQRLVSGPLLALADTADRITRERDYATRATVDPFRAYNEITVLTNSFNRMLTEIEQRDDTLLMHQTQLEETVGLRTQELTAANEELLRLAGESALILNTVTDGILGVGVDNRPTFLNPAGARILGRTLADLKGRTIHEAIHHSHPDGTPWPEADCANTQKMRRSEPVAITGDTFWRLDGTSFPVESASTAMFDEQGNHLGAVMVFRDVTERRAVERLKGEFVSTVSHELRTPLTSIRGALGLLCSGILGPIPDKGQRMLEIAVSNTDRLVRLINDILDLERVESGRVELKRGPVDAEAVMVQALEGVQSIADESGVRLVVIPARGTMWGDSDRIMQTLTNLLGNAIKFSPRDTTVTLRGVARQNDFLFCVADQGRGVPEQQLKTIFERFSQVDASDSRDKGGSGLGLAICQSIVNAHGGRIWAERNEPAGSRFQFTIPLAPAKSDDHLIPVFDQVSAAPAILVVEDDGDLARVMITALQSHGIRTFHALTGSDAIRLCEQGAPSLIVLDLGLPDMDGFAVVKTLRESSTLAGVPLLVYSAQDVGIADQARLRLGPTEFLTKSRCSLADFEANVVRLLETVIQHAA